MTWCGWLRLLPFLASLENTVRPKLQPPDGLRSLNSISACVCFTARRENSSLTDDGQMLDGPFWSALMKSRPLSDGRAAHRSGWRVGATLTASRFFAQRQPALPSITQG